MGCMIRTNASTHTVRMQMHTPGFNGNRTTATTSMKEETAMKPRTTAFVFRKQKRDRERARERESTAKMKTSREKCEKPHQIPQLFKLFFIIVNHIYLQFYLHLPVFSFSFFAPRSLHSFLSFSFSCCVAAIPPHFHILHGFLFHLIYIEHSLHFVRAVVVLASLPLLPCIFIYFISRRFCFRCFRWYFFFAAALLHPAFQCSLNSHASPVEMISLRFRVEWRIIY